MLLQQSNLVGRNNLGRWLNERWLTGVGVEVGTHLADYAKIILDNWAGRCLYCVDPWKNPPGYESQAKFLWGEGTREDHYQKAKLSLRPYGHRARMLRCVSEDAANIIQDSTLDFVYLDGDHSYEAVYSDLNWWWPKLKSGGVMLGHDIICPGEKDEENWGRFIQPAVFDFARPRALKVELVIELESLPWSYLIVKP